METELARPETIDAVLRIASWCVIGFAALWLVTSIIGAFYRRAYNLTHTESGSSQNVTPDFLKVDRAKREAAIARGQAYDQVLERREAAARAPVKTAMTWSRILATGAALVTFLTAVIGAFEKIEAYQDNLEEMGSFDRFMQLIAQNPIGTAVAVAVVAANIYLVARKIQKPE
jgi:hypothetical protein